MPNDSFASLTAQQLRRAASIKDQLDQLNSELSSILSGSPGLSRQSFSGGGTPKRLGRPPKNSLPSLASAKEGALSSSGSGRRKMSAAGRARIAAAARARWARYNAEKGGSPKKNSLPSAASAKGGGPSSGRRKMSAAARARIAAAARARWAKAKAAGKNSL